MSAHVLPYLYSPSRGIRKIASYGSVRTHAMRLGYRDVADTLQMTLDEEGQADKLLTQIAESSSNPQAASHA